MGIEARMTRAFAIDGVVKTGNVVRSEGLRKSYKEEIPGDETNFHLAGAFAAADIEAFWIKASRDCTLKTNDGTTPDDEFQLQAGEPIDWAAGQGINCPITQDVTGFYVTTPAGEPTILEMELLVDPSP